MEYAGYCAGSWRGARSIKLALVDRTPTNSSSVTPSHTALVSLARTAAAPRRNTAPLHSIPPPASCTLHFASPVSFTAALYTSFLSNHAAACESACAPVTRSDARGKATLLLPAALHRRRALVWSHSPPNHTAAPDQHTQARLTLSAAAGPSHHVRLRRARA